MEEGHTRRMPVRTKGETGEPPPHFPPSEASNLGADLLSRARQRGAHQDVAREGVRCNTGEVNKSKKTSAPPLLSDQVVESTGLRT